MLPARCRSGSTSTARNHTAKVAAVPERSDVDLQVEETLIVELYSK